MKIEAASPPQFSFPISKYSSILTQVIIYRHILIIEHSFNQIQLEKIFEFWFFFKKIEVYYSCIKFKIPIYIYCLVEELKTYEKFLPPAPRTDGRVQKSRILDEDNLRTGGQFSFHSPSKQLIYIGILNFMQL